MSDKNQITETSEFDISKLRYPEPIMGTIPNTKISFHRLPVALEYSPNVIGDLILMTERLYSFGLKENTDPGSNNPNGQFSLSLCLLDYKLPTSKEEQFIEVFKSIVQELKTYLLKLKYDEKFKKNGYAINEDNLTDFVMNSIYRGPRNGSELVNPEYKPVMSPKLIFAYKKNDQGVNVKTVASKFFDANTGEKISYEKLLNRPFYITAALKIEGVFINKKTISLQVKIIEGEIDFIDTNKEDFSLIKHHRAMSGHIKVQTRSEKRPYNNDEEIDTSEDNNKDDEDNNSSDNSSDDNSSEGKNPKRSKETTDDEEPNKVPTLPLINDEDSNSD